jgi:hypothetical protein
MWDDAKYWIPRALHEECMEEEFLYNEELTVSEHTLMH